MQNRQEQVPDQTAWHVQVWSYVAELGKGYQDGFEQIPQQYYPDNPAKDGFFPTGKTGLAKIFTDYILPILPLLSLITSWMDTAKTIKRFYHAENKNYDNTLDVTVSVLTTAAATTFWSLLLFGSTATAIFIAPYFMVSALGLGVAYGIYNVVKNICDIAVANSAEEKNRLRWEIWKQSLTFVVSTLAFATTIVFGLNIGPRLSSAADLLHDAVKNWDFRKLGQALVLVQAAGDSFRSAKSLYYIFTGFFSLSLITSAWELNHDTLALLSHPDEISDGIKTRYREVKSRFDELSIYAKPFVVLASVPLVAIFAALTALNILTRTVALITVWPLQTLFSPVDSLPQEAVPMAGGEARPVDQAGDNVFKNIEIESPDSSARLIQERLLHEKQREYAALCAMTEQKMRSLEEEIAEEPLPRRLDKLNFLTVLRNTKLGANIDTYDTERSVSAYANEAGSGTWQSFFHRTGRVQEIRHAHEAYERKWYPQH